MVANAGILPNLGRSIVESKSLSPPVKTDSLTDYILHSYRRRVEHHILGKCAWNYVVLQACSHPND